MGLKRETFESIQDLHGSDLGCAGHGSTGKGSSDGIDHRNLFPSLSPDSAHQLVYRLEGLHLQVMAQGCRLVDREWVSWTDGPP